MRKWVLWVLILVVTAAAVVFGFIWNSGGFGNGEHRTLNAKIRYFDGVSEMVELRRYEIMNGFARLDTAAGDRIYVGANNVIITNEEVDR